MFRDPARPRRSPSRPVRLGAALLALALAGCAPSDGPGADADADTVEEWVAELDLRIGSVATRRRS